MGWPDDVVARYVAEGYWKGLPLGDHFEAVVAHRRGAVAVVDGRVRLTFGELQDCVEGTAARLHGLGLRGGDRIVVALPNCWQFLVLVFACFRLGIAPVMALPAHGRRELGEFVDRVGAAGIAIGGDRAGVARELVGEDGLVLVVDAGPEDGVGPKDGAGLEEGVGSRDGVIGLGELCGAATGSAGSVGSAGLEGVVGPGSRSTALFLLSGGTTGVPKLIARTHDDFECAISASARACRFDHDTVFLVALPMGHNFALGGPGVLGALFGGGRVVISRSVAPQQVFPLIAAEGVTDTGLVPAIVQRWMDHATVVGNADLRSLELLQVGGSRLPDTEAARVRPVLGTVLQQGYGMAEGLICYNGAEDPESLTHHTQGRPVHLADELRVVDPDTGEVVEPGAAGLLLTRGPYTVRGYYQAPEHNARSFTADGFYRTGDIVEVGPGGDVVIVGRDKDMINRGGEKVSAEEVENLVLTMPAVARAAAVSMPDARLGERVCLYVVPRPGTTVRLPEVLAVMAASDVARFKFPERLVILDALPVTPVGKTDKKALRADIATRIAHEHLDTHAQ